MSVTWKVQIGYVTRPLLQNLDELYNKLQAKYVTELYNIITSHMKLFYLGLSDNSACHFPAFQKYFTSTRWILIGMSAILNNSGSHLETDLWILLRIAIV